MKVLLIMLLLLGSPAWASDWQLNHRGDGPGQVTTYVREVSNSPVKAFRGEVRVQASMVSVLAVLTAVDTFPQWIFQSQSARRLASDGQEKIYMRFNGIWPVSDRDVVIGNTFSQDTKGVITLHSTNLANQVKKNSNCVRIPDLDNRFVLTPLAGGGVKVRFETFVDPGGRVPVWLANLVATRAPLDTLRGLKAQLRKPRFAQATRQDLPKLPGIDQLTL